MRSSILFEVALVLCMTPSSVRADVSEDHPAGWGHFCGQFVYDGIPPIAEPLTVTKDPDAFGPTVPDESLLIDPETRGIANVAIYLQAMRRQKLHVHSSYDKTAQQPVRLRMTKGRYEPRLLLLRTSQVMIHSTEDRHIYIPHMFPLRQKGL